jgi:hypothetical protein
VTVHATINAALLKWGFGPDALPKGASMAVVAGDPSMSSLEPGFVSDSAVGRTWLKPSRDSRKRRRVFVQNIQDQQSGSVGVGIGGSNYSGGSASGAGVGEILRAHQQGR